MARLEIHDWVFQRDEKGELLPIERKLDKISGSPTVLIKPIERGKLQSVFILARSESLEDKSKSDLEIIREGLVEPKPTEEELKDMKPILVTEIAKVILEESLGRNITNNEQSIIDEEILLKKK